MISLEVEGIEQLKAGFTKYGKAADKAVTKAVNITALNIEKDAKSRLRGSHGSGKHWIIGTLAKSIYNRPTDKPGEKQVGTNLEYAPYIEFGTGDVVFENFDFSAEAKQYAAQYKGKGIRKVNIRGDSFLNWAAVNQMKKFRERVIAELNKLK